MVNKYDFSQFEVVGKFPNPTELKGLMKFICNIHIEVEDITSEVEKLNHQKVVRVTYIYDGKTYKTKPLYYKHVSHSRSVKEPFMLLEYFGQDVFWLDIDIHGWPQPSNETELDNLIINDITDDPEFRNFLKKLANNNNLGAIQRITKLGRSNQYYRNLENNNHWHDLVLMIQHIIRYGEMSQDLFMPLVFKWDGNKHTERLRSSLSPSFGSRALVTNLVDNVKKYFNPMDNKMIDLLQYKKQIILQGPPGTGKTKLAEELAQKIAENNKETEETYTVKNLTKEFIKAKLHKGDKIQSKSNKFFEIVALENNVVVTKSETSKAWKPSYNKIIDSFNNKFWEVKGRSGGFKPYEDAIAKFFYETYFNDIEHVDVQITSNFWKIVQFHPSYTYEDFVRGIVSKPNEDGDGIIYEVENKVLADFVDIAIADSENEYVLIIDEINRANLSSVFGELIYALEYRGMSVESMYAIDGDNKLTLPDNLYIIGTMNTADRSVGHIDYAIRRRFAFVDVLPRNLKNELNDDFDQALFNKVAKLFVKDFDPKVDYNAKKELLKNSTYLSEEFRPEYVWLGHSYFIKKDGATMEMRLEYEIKPILLEYIKDGVLKEEARPHVLALPYDIQAK